MIKNMLIFIIATLAFLAEAQTGSLSDENTVIVSTVDSFPLLSSYNGNLSVSGMVEVSSKGSSIKLNYTIITPACALNSSKANSCGIHVHKCSDCTEYLEGHYYNASVISADP